jgi:hypothetical protein
LHSLSPMLYGRVPTLPARLRLKDNGATRSEEGQLACHIGRSRRAPRHKCTMGEKPDDAVTPATWAPPQGTSALGVASVAVTSRAGGGRSRWALRRRCLALALTYALRSRAGGGRSRWALRRRCLALALTYALRTGPPVVLRYCRGCDGCCCYLLRWLLLLLLLRLLLRLLPPLVRRVRMTRSWLVNSVPKKQCSLLAAKALPSRNSYLPRRAVPIRSSTSAI